MCIDLALHGVLSKQCWVPNTEHSLQRRALAALVAASLTRSSLGARSAPEYSISRENLENGHQLGIAGGCHESIYASHSNPAKQLDTVSLTRQGPWLKVHLTANT